MRTFTVNFTRDTPTSVGDQPYVWQCYSFQVFQLAPLIYFLTQSPSVSAIICSNQVLKLLPPISCCLLLFTSFLTCDIRMNRAHLLPSWGSLSLCLMSSLPVTWPWETGSACSQFCNRFENMSTTSLH